MNAEGEKVVGAAGIEAGTITTPCEQVVTISAQFMCQKEATEVVHHDRRSYATTT